MKIKKSYHFYFVVVSIDQISLWPVVDNKFSEYIFEGKLPLPNWIQQGDCDLLHDHRGVILPAHVLEKIKPKQLFSEFNSGFAFSLPVDICDKVYNRYTKNYTFNFDIHTLTKEDSMEEILQYKKSAWKPILEIDPDMFYFTDHSQFLFGSKDYRQIEMFINENCVK